MEIDKLMAGDVELEFFSRMSPSRLKEDIYDWKKMHYKARILDVQFTAIENAFSAMIVYTNV